ncbi:septum formation initiator family protein [Candidatus Falkowbacteria bacterium]|jgi:cell division protein FtsB|nr:septum formation initiator family protein [Candidatus Falkowbacteria bacterium]MBT7007315.1 septum formation initiator family protein [Candidatus Falkowbacteria bacterium]
MTRSRKQNLTGNFFSKFLVIFLIIIFLLFLIGIVREYFNKKGLNNDINELSQELENLKLNQDKFLSSIDSYQNDFFTEQEAREKFNMQKPGEQVVVIPIENKQLVLHENQELINNQEEFNNTKSSNLVAWWDYFFDERS